jgi:predicted adenine nucleotide alpha hydrolase (AANH) superfamily ATPase
MKVLLHICCGPCAIVPTQRLREKDHEVMGYFFRSNIHPYTECLKREETLRNYADQIDLRVVYQPEYDLEEFLRNVVYRESNRCRLCYHERLRSAALIAKRGRFDAFTSTLLYSKFQNHELIKSIGESVGKTVGLPFYYEDFRSGWKAGVEASKQMGMYRQQYCGCIYSEKERYFKPAQPRPEI